MKRTFFERDEDLRRAERFVISDTVERGWPLAGWKDPKIAVQAARKMARKFFPQNSAERVSGDCILVDVSWFQVWEVVKNQETDTFKLYADGKQVSSRPLTLGLDANIGLKLKKRVFRQMVAEAQRRNHDKAIL